MSSTLTREPAHGTIIEYVQFNCRCKLCEDNWQINSDRYFYMRRSESDPKKVPPDIVADHIATMLEMGFEVAAIADGAGVSRDTVLAVAGGRATRLQRRTADAILALDPSQPIPNHRVPLPIVRAMLDEMRGAGLTLQWIYRTAGISPKFQGNRRRCSWENYVKLRRVYDVLKDAGLIGEGDDGATA